MVLVIAMKTIFVFNAIKGDIFPSTKLCFFFTVEINFIRSFGL